ncbi:uncharacterized protein LOC109844231 [Asparagus officinalis]|uniref:uncharacterized protein LOC109844231 n=1 Tax=Asparagus officinalis TaxID=4686 RepID=UPI00098DF3C3|nr:uncharacterized protein LOC109844231 [Asparagus officinalis]
MASSASNPSHPAGEQSHRGPSPNPPHLGLGESGWKSAEGGNPPTTPVNSAGGDAGANDEKLKTTRVSLYALFVFSSAVMLANWTGSRTPNLWVVVCSGVFSILSVVLLVILEIFKIPIALMTVFTAVAWGAIIALGLLITNVEIKSIQG